ncbi:unnamed protein product [Nippostrongylus brasiliensis]|uniref:SCP domain-containing protein n=1 Tax=Nippostrongylus brasiliensis TaxID=27835 RepID=A0A158R0B2_NIPBR|nr:unnamed protein product [Nippostrongylus brasiliensis]
MPSVGGYSSNMFRILLSLIILQAIETQATLGLQAPISDIPLLTDIVGKINKLRTAIATGQDAQKNKLYMPQSDQMFKLVYDADLTRQAMMLTLMCDDVQPPPAPNSYVYYRSGKTVDNAVVDGALLYWYNLADNNMDANATYTSILNGFAQRYDQLLGADAQAYAESCPTSAVPTINNYAYGQNMLIIYTVRKAYSDLIKMAIRFWSDEIHNNMINSNMNFNDFVVKRPTPPISFTQMVWANHKTVGCGAHRCGSYTVIVCRYKPGGNIIGEFVYNVGPPCSACQYGCNNQSLCIVPVGS